MILNTEYLKGRRILSSPSRVLYIAMLTFFFNIQCVTGQEKSNELKWPDSDYVTFNTPMVPFPVNFAFIEGGSKEIPKIKCLSRQDQSKMAILYRVYLRTNSPYAIQNQLSLRIIRDEQDYKMKRSNIGKSRFIFQLMESSGSTTAEFLSKRPKNSNHPTYIHMGNDHCIYLGEYSTVIFVAQPPICAQMISLHGVEYRRCTAFFDYKDGSKIYALFKMSDSDIDNNNLSRFVKFKHNVEKFSTIDDESKGDIEEYQCLYFSCKRKIIHRFLFGHSLANLPDVLNSNDYFHDGE